MKPGLVYLPPSKKGGYKPFLDYRQIQRGKDKGKLEVTIQPARNPKKVIVEASAIKRLPSS